MPEFSLPDTAYKKILANTRNPMRLRLAALKAMSRPPLMFLMRLERDPATPDKLRFAIVQRRELETLIRKEKPANDEMGPRRQAADVTADC
jgi:hypothetical protein